MQGMTEILGSTNQDMEFKPAKNRTKRSGFWPSSTTKWHEHVTLIAGLIPPCWRRASQYLRNLGAWAQAERNGWDVQNSICMVSQCKKHWFTLLHCKLNKTQFCGNKRAMRTVTASLDFDHDRKPRDIFSANAWPSISLLYEQHQTSLVPNRTNSFNKIKQPKRVEATQLAFFVITPPTHRKNKKQIQSAPTCAALSFFSSSSRLMRSNSSWSRFSLTHPESQKRRSTVFSQFNIIIKQQFNLLSSQPSQLKQHSAALSVGPVLVSSLGLRVFLFGPLLLGDATPGVQQELPQRSEADGVKPMGRWIQRTGDVFRINRQSNVLCNSFSCTQPSWCELPGKPGVRHLYKAAIYGLFFPGHSYSHRQTMDGFSLQCASNVPSVWTQVACCRPQSSETSCSNIKLNQKSPLIFWQLATTLQEIVEYASQYITKLSSRRMCVAADWEG